MNERVLWYPFSDERVAWEMSRGVGRVFVELSLVFVYICVYGCYLLLI